MRFTLSLSRDTAAPPSPRVRAVAAMFGLGDDASRTQTIVPPTTLDLPPGHIALITGPSGGGKSSILRLIRDAARERDDMRVIDLDELPPLPDKPLIDALAAFVASTNRTRDMRDRCDTRDERDARGTRDDEQPTGLHRALRLLSLAGLSDAFVMLRRPRELSDGQRCRLQLAHAFARAEVDADAASTAINQSQTAADGAQTPATLTLMLADEFGATLDRLTAKVIAQNVRRWIDRRAPHVCFVAATTDGDLIDALSPDVVIEKELGDAIHVHDRRRLRLRAPDRSIRRATPPSTVSIQHAALDDRVLDEGATKEKPDNDPRRSSESEHGMVVRPSREAASGEALTDCLRLRTGSMADYHALAPFHYRAAKPATVSRILALRDESATLLDRRLGRRAARTAAVLIESRPILDCRGRDAALGGRYRLADRRQRAALINAELRCISRVIVHPQWRGLGLATRLVRAALATATTAYTEAIAAMGRVHPFFERAGMTAYDPPHARRDARLVAALERADLPPGDLMNADPAAKRLAALTDDQRAWLIAELRRWCRPGRVDAGADGDRATRERASCVERVSANSRADDDPRRACEAASGEVFALLDAVRRRLLFRPIYYLHDNR